MKDSFKGTGVWSFVEFDRKMKDDADEKAEEASTKSSTEQSKTPKNVLKKKQ